ncbi:hypothetical protein [Enterobacter asburiae]|uniref:hypothetical protein n=1 Tax=Enterobacter asburiae TaxID=61645 RepID=UPI000B2A4BC6|nr:hypothetical protein [Enterobacter asburiae]
MSADRARRDIQCFSRFAEGVQPRGNFKSAQRAQLESLLRELLMTFPSEDQNDKSPSADNTNTA